MITKNNKSWNNYKERPTLKNARIVTEEERKITSKIIIKNKEISEGRRYREYSCNIFISSKEKWIRF